MKRKLWIVGLTLIGVSSMLISSCNKNDKEDIDPNTVKDIDGNVYITVTIGTQVWMVENLKTTKYRDGTSIPNVTNNTSWNSLTTGAYSDYDNTPSNSDTHGRLYNWYTVSDTRNIAPVGWHVPTTTEWDELVTYAGGAIIAGTKLKNPSGWYWGGSGTDNFGFKALPGGCRYYTGPFNSFGEVGIWWTATGYNATYALYRYMDYNNTGVYTTNYDWGLYSYNTGYKKFGFSVRCVKDK